MYLCVICRRTFKIALCTLLEHGKDARPLIRHDQELKEGSVGFIPWAFLGESTGAPFFDGSWSEVTDGAWIVLPEKEGERKK